MLGLASCINEAEKYYTQESAVVHEGTLWEYAQSLPEYSEFCNLVKEVECVDYLDGTTLMTLCIPDNESMPESVGEMNDADKKMTVLNHIALTTIYGRNMERMTAIRTLAGKNVNVTTKDGARALDGVTLSEMDQVCLNGVMHKADEWIMPRKNLREWISDLPDDYSIIRDSILNCEERTFDKASSPVIGVGEDGKVVYDSVWVVKNEYLNNADVSQESARYSIMAPSNKCIDNLLKERNEWLVSMGQPELNAADSAGMVKWLLKAALLRGSTSFPSGSSIKSVNGNEIRTDYFHYSELKPLSNGVAVILDTCYVPKDMHYKKVSFNPYYIRLVVPKQSEKAATQNGIVFDTFYPSVNKTNVIAKSDSQCANIQFDTNNPTGYYYKFMSMTSSDSTATATLTPLPIMQGKYNLRMRLCTNDSNTTDSFDIYRLSSLAEDAEEELLATITGVTKKNFGILTEWDTDGLVKANIEVTTLGEPFYIKIVIPRPGANGPARRMFVGTCTLVPQDNY